MAPDIITVAHRDTLEELNGIQSEAITVTDGRSRSYHLRLERERMTRIQARARYFNIYLPDA